ncbi:MAG: hypothetical protein QNJ75_01200 [Acidimicrobiia bacterium]|nr:hypothetical protein [Acidimicrobiia bacterium]
MLDERQVIELVRRVDPVEDLEDLPDPRLTAAEVLGVRSLDELATTSPKTHTRQLAGLPIWRGTAIATATTVLALLAVGVMALVGRGQSEEVASPVPTTTATAIEPITSVPTFSWQASEPLSSWFMHLEAFDGGFVAVYDFVAPGILASQDGLEWAPLEDQPAAANHIAVHGGALYAGGNREWFERLDSFGATWEQLPMDDPGVAFDIVHVASSQTGIVIYGEGRTGEHLLWRLEGDAFELVPIDTNSEIDIPTDMTALPPTPQPGLREPFSTVVVNSIDALADGFLAELHMRRFPVEGPETARVIRFRSRDGIEWAPLEGPHRGEGIGFVGFADAIIATSHWGSAWLSEDDGLSWQTIDLEIGHPLVATPFGWAYALGGVGPFSQTDGVELTLDGRESTTVLADRKTVIAIAADENRLVIADGNVIWVGEIVD